MNNNMEISKPRFSADALFPPPRIYSFIIIHFLQSLRIKIIKRNKWEENIYNKRIYIFTFKKSSISRHLETDQAGLTLTRDFVFSEQNFNRSFFNAESHLNLFLIFLLSSQHCNKTLRVDKSLIINVHIIIRIVDLLRGKFVTIRHQGVPQSTEEKGFLIFVRTCSNCLSKILIKKLQIE